MFFQILESSSSGNCSFLECDGVRILIDAGIGIRKIGSFLAQRSLKLSDLDAVFVTHEHIDHYKSLRCFAGEGVKIFANRPTAEGVQYKDSETKRLDWHLFETGTNFDFYGVGVSSFSIPHDTSDPVGFTFSFGGENLVYATDLGKVTLSVKDVVSRADVLVLESNYCPRMLDNSNRPFSLKSRIKSSYGHLSNSDAISVLRGLPERVKKVYLSHISKQCNSPEHIAELLAQSDIPRETLAKIEIVSPFAKQSTPFEF